MDHLWDGFFDDDDMFDLDDRGPDSLEVQIVNELRRLSAFCNQLADETEARIAEEALDVA